jgi:hypothetical protein
MAFDFIPSRTTPGAISLKIVKTGVAAKATRSILPILLITSWLHTAYKPAIRRDFQKGFSGILSGNQALVAIF